MPQRNTIKSKRVGIWLRVSTEDQMRGENPETHERRARLYAEAKGWSVIEVSPVRKRIVRSKLLLIRGMSHV